MIRRNLNQDPAQCWRRDIELPLTLCRGQEEYERLRPLSYSKGHVILIAFSVDSPDSLDNVSQKASYFQLAAPYKR